MEAFDILIGIYSFLRPVLDIGLLTFVLYKAYDLIMRTNAVQILKAAIIVSFIYIIAVLLNLQTILWILNVIAPGLLISFAIVFQPEFRKIFLRLGQTGWFTFGNRSKHTAVEAVLLAAEILSQQRRGMLAVFLRHTKVDDLFESGTVINADISSNLLVTIFGHDTPLHDGACFIQGGKLIAAGCFLPVSNQYDIKKTFGSRHRAALGLSEVSDSVVLVVSEETGAISLAYDSKLHYDLSNEQLTHMLESLLDLNAAEKKIEEK